mmetsp:Transcript_35935/g.56342  ORF Transcript_35935/g.56342 Transcript_35935/m.56342 type:complete len:298 (-) Transcript_35935:469-1362(-)
MIEPSSILTIMSPPLRPPPAQSLRLKASSSSSSASCRGLFAFFRSSRKVIPVCDEFEVLEKSGEMQTASSHNNKESAVGIVRSNASWRASCLWKNTAFGARKERGLLLRHQEIERAIASNKNRPWKSAALLLKSRQTNDSQQAPDGSSSLCLETVEDLEEIMLIQSLPRATACFMAEVPQFLLAVREYKRCGNDTQRQYNKYIEITNTFIEPDSQCEINISAADKLRIQRFSKVSFSEWLESPASERSAVFDNAAQEMVKIWRNSNAAENLHKLFIASPPFSTHKSSLLAVMQQAGK